jgi:hypothetical protein
VVVPRKTWPKPPAPITPCSVYWLPLGDTTCSRYALSGSAGWIRTRTETGASRAGPETSRAGVETYLVAATIRVFAC